MYKEYKDFPRRLKIHRVIWLRLWNVERMDILKTLSRAEARGKRCYIDKLDEEERLQIYEALEFDVESIGEAVRERKTPGYRRSWKRWRLAELIEWEEAKEGDGLEFADDEPPVDQDGDSAMEE